MSLLWLPRGFFSCFYLAFQLESRLLFLEAIKQNFGFRLLCDLLCMHLLQECFHEKDFLNHRYHAKRCLYLCVVEKNLRCSKLIRKVSWSTLQDEARKPVLHVYPGYSSINLPLFSHHWCTRIWYFQCFQVGRLASRSGWPTWVINRD